MPTPTDSSPQHEQPIDLTRSRAAARHMSDQELAELHAQGRDALRPGAWEVLDEELRRRARGPTAPRGLAAPRFHEVTDAPGIGALRLVGGIYGVVSVLGGVGAWVWVGRWDLGLPLALAIWLQGGLVWAATDVGATVAQTLLEIKQQLVRG